MMHLSKSKYCYLWRCPKLAWINKYKPEQMEVSESDQRKFDAGNEIGDLAMGLFGDFTEVTAYAEDGKLDLTAMIQKTEEEMAKGTAVICEASFSYDGLYCAVDLLKKEEDGYAIYEVKSSTTEPDEKEAKPIYVADIAYQKYVLENCGVHVSGTYLVTLNKKYVRGEELELSKLFNIMDVSEFVENEYPNVPKMLLLGKEVLLCKDEPDIPMSCACKKPYECPCMAYCTSHLPKPNVFDVAGMNFDKKLKMCEKGIVSFEDLQERGGLTNEKSLRQIDHYLNEREDYVDKAKIREFLDTLSYPIYFLDFEGMQPAVPLFAGTKPYQQIAFQYSLHYIEEPGGQLKHKEFLATSGVDPRREVAQALCRDIPKDVCVIAYNKSYECGRIKEMAEAFPDLAEHLQNIKENVRDVMNPFRSGHYYNRAMEDSYSIKYVLPALYPDDPSLDYHNLDGVHNGTEAMDIFPRIQDMPEKEQKKARESLLAYCKLDTYAMVKVWKKLVECCK